jgi:hypothetical protein
MDPLLWKAIAMQRHVSRRILRPGISVGLWLLSKRRGRPADIEGYAGHDAYRLQLESIAQSEVQTRAVGAYAGNGNHLTVGSGNRRAAGRLIVGSVHPPHLPGSELASGAAFGRAGQSDQAVRVARWVTCT